MAMTMAMTMTSIKLTVIFAASLAGLTAGTGLARAADLDSAPAPVFLNRPGWSGVGLNLGNVETGATAKMWATSRMAVQAAVGAPPQGNAARVNVDLTYAPYQWRSTDGQYALPFYFGVGGVLGHSFASGGRPASTETGARTPLGMSILVRDNPVELFFEIAPEITIRSPATVGRYTLYCDGAIGLRYYL